MYRRITTCLTLAFLLAACSSADEALLEDAAEAKGQTQLRQDSETETQVAAAQPLVSKTNPYPAIYNSEAAERGQVVEISYDTRDYVSSNGASRRNNTYVYLPYGYEQDTERRYNVVYLVHGHYGNASTFLSADNDELRKVLDHMIMNGDIDPTIVVTPSYNYGQPTSNYVDADDYCRALPTELQNDLIPLIDSRYRTHASRDGRAIGGFSMGGVTTWYALELTPDLYRYYLPMSGDSWALGAFAGMNRPEATAAHLAAALRANNIQTTDFYIWSASGTSDSAYRETLNQVEGMNRYGEPFTTANLTFHEKDGARHEYLPMVEYIYNALPFFFPPTEQNTTGIKSITM